jgi:16S rRNA (cytosine967-C5)-methyltransferase
MIEASMGKEVAPENLWEFVGTWFLLQDEKLPYWDEFKKLSSKDILKRNHAASDKNFAIRESIPDWLNELGKKELGKQWEKEIEAMNIPAPTVIRVNTLKTDRKSLKNDLRQERIDTEVLSKYPDALQLVEKANIFRTDAFQNGLFEIQDAGSQMISPYLNIQPGMRIVDACAGAGGKTLHLSALMENKGQIYALDIHEWKLQELKKRAKRAGAQNIQTKVIDSTKVIKKLENSADRLLIDAPCSGLGVLSRNPDAKWKLSLDFIETVKKEQEKILNDYCKMVKPGGAMVYATCSILPSENQEQVQKFLSNHPEFKLVREKQILPSQSGFDGFYMAYLEKH